MGLKDYPTGAESLKVKEEIKITGKQSASTFTERIPMLVAAEIRRNERDSVWNDVKLMAYGYILGIRAERARRKKVNK